RSPGLPRRASVSEVALQQLLDDLQAYLLHAALVDLPPRRQPLLDGLLVIEQVFLRQVGRGLVRPALDLLEDPLGPRLRAAREALAEHLALDTGRVARAAGSASAGRLGRLAAGRRAAPRPGTAEAFRGRGGRRAFENPRDGRAELPPELAQA